MLKKTFDRPMLWAYRVGMNENNETKFSVGDTLIMHSPFTNEDTLVNFRGFLGSDKAVVIPITTGMQMSVAKTWLRKDKTLNDKEVA